MLSLLPTPQIACMCVDIDVVVDVFVEGDRDVDGNDLP
jgi:hypothetical protein